MSFDLEKARALAYRASEYKVWTPPGATGHGSDLNKYREWQAVVEICDKRYPEALDQITDLTQNCNSLRTRAQKAEAEIERLRGFETAARDLNNDLIRIAGERDELAASVQELEDALAEYQRLGKTISEVVVPCLTAHGNCDQCRPKAKAACDAIETIRKGKIGSGDHIGEPNKLIGLDAKPRSWQITEERKAALNRAYDIVAWADRNSSPENRAHIATILAMLKEAERE